NGEITDPPAPLETPSQTRYAQSVSDPPSQGLEASLGSLFCQRCLLNQHIVNQALAEYMPTPTASNFSELERQASQYRSDLQERYPQVCESCATRVEARIKATGYAAKTDHLRRMMDRTRSANPRRSSWGWKHFAVVIGTLGWAGSAAGQLFWNILGALSGTEQELGLVNEDELQSMSHCIWQIFEIKEVAPQCLAAFDFVATLSMATGLLCLWWHPWLWYKLSGKFGRLTGLTDYYKFHVMFLAFRFVAWKALGKHSPFHLEGPTLRAGHALMAVLTLLFAVMLFRTVQVDRTPLVSFQENYEPLVPTINRPEHENSSPLLDLRRRSTAKQSSTTQQVTRAPTPGKQAYRPLTPPPEEDDTDGMDWTPTQSSFRPASNYRSLPSQPKSTEPSPFYGHLPPAPMSLAQRLRNPPTKPPFRKATEAQKKSFFQRALPEPAADDDDNQSPAKEALSEIPSPAQFAPPSFFPKSDRADTGLESLFGGSLSISGGQSESMKGEDRSLASGQSQLRQQQMVTRYSASRVFSILLLALSCVAWDFSLAAFPILETQVRIACLATAQLVSAFDIWSSLQMGPQTSFASVLLFQTEIIVAAYFDFKLLKSDKGDDVKQEFLSALGLWFLIWMTARGMWVVVAGVAMSPYTPPTPNSASSSSAQTSDPSKPTYSSPPAVSKNSQTPKVVIPRAQPQVYSAGNPQVSQRTTRSKARKDSLGMGTGFGSLSLG
ncbi:MAG: hypothetical protein Q9214_004178, partial [Letrouitia sp. 1 TL-2023]